MTSARINRRLLLVSDRRQVGSTDASAPLRRFRLARVTAADRRPAGLPVRKPV